MPAKTTTQLLAHDDSGGTGRLALLIPGAGDIRSEHRFLVPPLAEAGFRVVNVDLPGHGGSAPAAEYTVGSTATAIIDLLEAKAAGPAVVVACSFAPAAAVWVAAERPDLVAGIVAISPHLTADESLKGRMQAAALGILMRGPWAASLWAKFYSGWYKTDPPADLDRELAVLRSMFSDPARRRAARETLTASRDGVAERIDRIAVPTLTVFGSLDDHFADPAGEAVSIAAQLGGTSVVVRGAGHYPHVEQPDVVYAAIASFLDGIA